MALVPLVASATAHRRVSLFLSTLFALCAAAMFGTSTVLQQTAARHEQSARLVSIRIVAQLVRRPRWLAAVGLSVASFAAQALALAFGPLVLVLPIAATDLLFALPLLAHRRHARLRVADWMGSALVAGGVAAFLALSPPTSGHAEPDLSEWLLVFAGVGGVVAVMLLMAYRRSAIGGSVLLAGAGALVFALVDALTKAVVELIGSRGVATLTRWEPYALLLAGLTGIVLGQSVYRSGSLFVSLPVIDSVEPLGGVVIGVTAFGEQIARSPAVLASQMVAGLIVVVGMAVLRRSPLISLT